jgi:hypothetical protein
LRLSDETMTQLRGFSDRYGVPQNIAVERMVDLIASLDDPMAVLRLDDPMASPWKDAFADAPLNPSLRSHRAFPNARSQPPERRAGRPSHHDGLRGAAAA